MSTTEMIEAIEATFEDVAQCVEVEGNPNLMGLYLFRVTDSQGKSGRVWFDPHDNTIVTPDGQVIALEQEEA